MQEAADLLTELASKECPDLPAPLEQGMVREAAGVVAPVSPGMLTQAALAVSSRGSCAGGGRSCGAGELRRGGALLFLAELRLRCQVLGVRDGMVREAVTFVTPVSRGVAGPRRRLSAQASLFIPSLLCLVWAVLAVPQAGGDGAGGRPLGSSL